MAAIVAGASYLQASRNWLVSSSDWQPASIIRHSRTNPFITFILSLHEKFMHRGSEEAGVIKEEEVTCQTRPLCEKNPSRGVSRRGISLSWAQERKTDPRI